MRKTRNRPAEVPLSDVQRPRSQRCAPTGPYPGRRRRQLRGPRPGCRARAGAAMAGDNPRVVGNGAPGGSLRPAPDDRLDGVAESCGYCRGRPARGGERSSQSARTGAGAPRPPPLPPDRKNTTPRDSTASTAATTRAPPIFGPVRADPRIGQDRRGPSPVCVMRAQCDAVHPTSRRARSARQNPPALDSCEPTSHDVS